MIMNSTLNKRYDPCYTFKNQVTTTSFNFRCLHSFKITKKPILIKKTACERFKHHTSKAQSNNVSSDGVKKKNLPGNATSDSKSDAVNVSVDKKITHYSNMIKNSIEKSLFEQLMEVFCRNKSDDKNPPK